MRIDRVVVGGREGKGRLGSTLALPISGPGILNDLFDFNPQLWPGLS